MLERQRAFANHLQSNVGRHEYSRKEACRIQRLGEVRSVVQSHRPPRPQGLPHLGDRSPCRLRVASHSPESIFILRQPRARSSSPGLRLEPLRHRNVSRQPLQPTASSPKVAIEVLQSAASEQSRLRHNSEPSTPVLSSNPLEYAAALAGPSPPQEKSVEAHGEVRKRCLPPVAPGNVRGAKGEHRKRSSSEKRPSSKRDRGDVHQFEPRRDSHESEKKVGLRDESISNKSVPGHNPLRHAPELRSAPDRERMQKNINPDRRQLVSEKQVLRKSPPRRLEAVKIVGSARNPTVHTAHEIQSVAQHTANTLQDSSLAQTSPSHGRATGKSLDRANPQSLSMKSFGDGVFSDASRASSSSRAPYEVLSVERMAPATASSSPMASEISNSSCGHATKNNTCLEENVATALCFEACNAAASRAETSREHGYGEVHVQDCKHGFPPPRMHTPSATTTTPSSAESVSRESHVSAPNGEAGWDGAAPKQMDAAINVQISRIDGNSEDAEWDNLQRVVSNSTSDVEQGTERRHQMIRQAEIISELRGSIAAREAGVLTITASFLAHLADSAELEQDGPWTSEIMYARDRIRLIEITEEAQEAQRGLNKGSSTSSASNSCSGPQHDEESKVCLVIQQNLIDKAHNGNLRRILLGVHVADENGQTREQASASSPRKQSVLQEAPSDGDHVDQVRLVMKRNLVEKVRNGQLWQSLSALRSGSSSPLLGSAPQPSSAASAVNGTAPGVESGWLEQVRLLMGQKLLEKTENGKLPGILSGHFRSTSEKPQAHHSLENSHVEKACLGVPSKLSLEHRELLSKLRGQIAARELGVSNIAAADLESFLAVAADAVVCELAASEISTAKQRISMIVQRDAERHGKEVCHTDSATEVLQTTHESEGRLERLNVLNSKEILGLEEAPHCNPAPAASSAGITRASPQPSHGQLSPTGSSDSSWTSSEASHRSASSSHTSPASQRSEGRKSSHSSRASADEEHAEKSFDSLKIDESRTDLELKLPSDAQIVVPSSNTEAAGGSGTHEDEGDDADAASSTCASYADDFEIGEDSEGENSNET